MKPSEFRTFTIDQILTPEEIQKAIKLYRELKGTGSFARTLESQIILPNMQRINDSLGQENVPLFLAYSIEYMLMKGEK